MKKVILVLPLAILLVNCSSTRNTTSSSTNQGMNATGSTAGTAQFGGTAASGSFESSGSGASASASGSMSGSANSNITGTHTSESTSGSMNSSSPVASHTGGANHSSSLATINWDVYDPNNYMMNPEKYRRRKDLGKTGGWTYNKDWRVNTNFTPEAVGQWRLVLTPEVTAYWMPDTRSPEMYASFWTPEAIMSRYQASMAAERKTQDSIAAVNAMATANTSRIKGKRKTSAVSNKTGLSATTTAPAEMSGATGSGTTGTMGTGGSSSIEGNMNATGTMNNHVTIPYALTAVNGNNYLLPSLNLHIDNGSFTAYTGCNNALGTIVVNGTSFRFEEASPLTSVECIGGFDQAAFMDRLRRADSYDVENNQFRLKQGDQVLMVFAKSNL